MEYETFYGFKREPFSDTPDPDLFYSGPEHSRAFIKLLHIIRKKRALGILTGEIGCGKTTLSRKILNELKKDENIHAGLMILTHPGFNVDWFLTRLAQLLNVETDSFSHSEIIGEITNKLFRLHQEGKHTIVIIDEANNITNPGVMEEIRGLLNLELTGSRLITIILSGMPELINNLRTNPSLNQRVSSIIRLSKLSLNSTREYIRFRVKQAGVDKDVFTQNAVDSIYNHSRGVPRLINVICDNALLEGAMFRKNPVDADIVNRVCEEMGLG